MCLILSKELANKILQAPWLLPGIPLTQLTGSCQERIQATSASYPQKTSGYFERRLRKYYLTHPYRRNITFAQTVMASQQFVISLPVCSLKLIKKSGCIELLYRCEGMEYSSQATFLQINISMSQVTIACQIILFLGLTSQLSSFPCLFLN